MQSGISFLVPWIAIVLLCLVYTEGATQGDPLSMAIYDLGTLPLVSHAKTADVTQAWFADDASAADKLSQLHKWWTILAEVGPRYGYFVNAPKTWLVVKENLYEVAVSLFDSTGVQITTEGRPLFGGPLGTSQCTNDFIRKATEEWKVEIEELAKIARPRRVEQVGLSRPSCGRLS